MMHMIRRGRRNNRYTGGSMKFKSMKDCQVLAFYLYELLDWKSKSETPTIESYSVKMFLELSKNLDVQEPLSAYLQDAVDKAARQGVLQPVTCKGPDGDVSCIGYSSVPVAYKVDSRIERWMGDDYPFTSMSVNLVRILFSDESKCSMAGSLKELVEKFFLPRNGSLKKALEDASVLDFTLNVSVTGGFKSTTPNK